MTNMKLPVWWCRMRNGKGVTGEDMNTDLRHDMKEKGKNLTPRTWPCKETWWDPVRILVFRYKLSNSRERTLNSLRETACGLVGWVRLGRRWKLTGNSLSRWREQLENRVGNLGRTWLDVKTDQWKIQLQEKINGRNSKEKFNGRNSKKIQWSK